MPYAARALAVPKPMRSGLLEPESIAVVGASDQPGNLGGRIISFLDKFGFSGKVYPVNPRRDEVAGMRCYPSATDLPEVPGLAVIVVSAALAVEAVKGCIAGGIRNGIVLAGGFAEVGPEGKAMQEELAVLCRANDFQLCGPNTLGIINTWLPMTASFASHLIDLQKLRPGNISIVSQSGGTAAVVHALAERAGFGLRYLISAGNEAVMGVADYLRLIADDPHTKIVAMYLEGTRDGDDFLEALGRVRAAGKPVVMLKAGVAEVSARAAAAHTGSLAGEARVWDAVLSEFGVIRVSTLMEMLDTVLALSAADALPKGPRIAIIASDHDAADIVVDQMAREGLSASASIQPLARGLGGLLDRLAADTSVDAIYVEGTLAGLTPPDVELVAGTMAKYRERGTKVAFVSLPSTISERLADVGVYAFPETSRAVETISRLVRAGGAPEWAPRHRPPPSSFAWEAHVADPKPGTVISEHLAHSILGDAGLHVAAGQLVTSRDDAVEAARRVEYPVAMKGISPAITHRAAAGLLALGIDSDAQTLAEYHRLVARAREIDAELDGVYIQHMERDGTEIIVSALRDSIFGVVVTCGAGGTATEMIDDVAIERAPVDIETAKAMLGKLRTVAREPQTDLTRLATFVADFSRLAASAPFASFAFEVNPVKWSSGRAVAVDGLLVIDE